MALLKGGADIDAVLTRALESLGIARTRAWGDVASKVSALVERGAPGDFRDIHSLYEAGLCNAARSSPIFPGLPWLVRRCSAWDFGILPDGENLRELRRHLA